METIGIDTTALDGNESLANSTQPKEIMGVTEIAIVDARKESTDVDPDAMMVVETENSTSSTKTKVIMDQTEINNADTTKQPTDIDPDKVLVEETENAMGLTQSKEMGSTEVPMENMMDIEVGFTEIKEYIMSFPEKTILVRIQNAWLTRKDLECLLEDGRWLDGDVITAYIYYLRTQQHLFKRAGGHAFLENTHISGKLKRDGEFPISPADHPNIVRRALNYLEHDMLFVPINVTKFHWYLCHIDPKKCRIQVFDSFGSGVNRSDLHLTLQGLENHSAIVSQMSEFNIGEKWVDLQVTQWPVVECIQEQIQTDGSSCGLFMLQFMEYFTGEDLAHAVTQEGIKPFREHVAIVLHESVLNEIKGTPVYEKDVSNSDAFNSDDCMIVEDPNQLGLSDGVENKCPIPVQIMSMDPHEIFAGLCKQIMLIQDADCLEKEWMHSSKPYPIGLSLKKIQNIIRMDQPMDNDCFNLAIHTLACDEILQLVETDIHYMDLRFCTAMIDSTRGDKWRIKPNIQSLATLFDSWPGIDYKIASRKLVLLPYASIGHFILFSIDKHTSRVYVFYPLSVSSSPESKMMRTHGMELKFLRISIYLNDALALAQPGWNSDIFFWPRRSPVEIPTSLDRNLSGYIVFYIILSWNGKELVHPVCTDGSKLRKKFLLHLLKYHENEAQDNIPNVVRQYLNRINE